MLSDMAEHGKIDREVLGLFREALAEKGDDIHLFSTQNQECREMREAENTLT